MKNSISSTNDCAAANGAGPGGFPTSARASAGNWYRWASNYATFGSHVDLAVAVFAGFIRWSVWFMEPLNLSKFPWFTGEFAHPGALKAV